MKVIKSTYLRLTMSLPVMGDPGSAGHVGGVSRSDLVLLGNRKSALRRQVAANSRVGAGMAALWGWDSILDGE